MKASVKEIMSQAAESFQKLSTAQQEQTRKAIYEKITGKPYMGIKK
jgi:hypothetical protein